MCFIYNTIYGCNLKIMTPKFENYTTYENVYLCVSIRFK